MSQSSLTAQCSCGNIIYANAQSHPFPDRINKVIGFTCSSCTKTMIFSSENASDEFLKAALAWNDSFYNWEG